MFHRSHVEKTLLQVREKTNVILEQSSTPKSSTIILLFIVRYLQIICRIQPYTITHSFPPEENI